MTFPAMDGVFFEHSAEPKAHEHITQHGEYDGFVGPA